MEEQKAGSLRYIDSDKGIEVTEGFSFNLHTLAREVNSKPKSKYRLVTVTDCKTRTKTNYTVKAFLKEYLIS